MKKASALLILGLACALFLPAAVSDDFSRAIAYFLVGDVDQARKSLDSHFARRPQPAVRQGFALLLQDDKWEAMKRFRDYLESDRRSLEALVGVSLATADMKDSMAVDNLNKALRMDPGFAAAYLCLGNEYMQRGNYPAAEDYLSKSLKYAPVPEFKILLAELYLKSSQAQKAFDLIRPEAEAAPKNYYFALQAARACLRLDGCQDTPRYVEQALRARPASREAQLLKGQHLLKAGELAKAKALLAKLRFERYNPEFSLTFAEVLLRLKDRDAEKYLYEVFSQNPWLPGVNKLLGLFHARKKSASVQNWIRRALLAGLPAQELRQEFPGQYGFPEYPFFPMFEAKKLQWLGSRRFLAAGTLRSGEKEKLVVLDAGSLKPVKTFEYEGAILDIFPSSRLDKVIFSTSATENEKVYIYTLVASGDTYKLKPVIGYALDMASIQAAFSEDGATAYVSDGSLPELAFTSPFSALSAYGRKKPIYPEYPFPVYSYSFASDRWAQVKSREALRRVPLPALQRYLQVADAYRENAEVAKLLDRGQRIEITSSEEMRIHFGTSGRHFLISLSDLKNAFRAWVYDAGSGQLARFDETMFLGEKYYAEVDIIAFYPEKSEILVCTRDKARTLVHFNYRSLLYKKLGNNVMKAAAAPDMNTVYVLGEKNKSIYYSDANLEIIRLSPFDRSRFDSRRDLNAIVDCNDRQASFFSTYNGELLKLDEEGNFSGRQVSLAGALHQASPDKGRAAAFINGRVYALEWMR